MKKANPRKTIKEKFLYIWKESFPFWTFGKFTIIIFIKQVGQLPFDLLNQMYLMKYFHCRKFYKENKLKICELKQRNKQRKEVL